MNKIITLLFAAAVSTQYAFSQSMPSRASVLKTMERVNDYFISVHPDPTKPTFVKKERPSNLWTRGVYFEGLMALTDIEMQMAAAEHDSLMKKAASKAGDYRRYIKEWGTFHKWTPRNGVATKDADDYCCSQTYIDMFMLTPGESFGHQKDYIIPSTECMNNLLMRDNTDWTWIDAIQMGLPVLAKLERAKYLTEGKIYPQYMEKGWNMYKWTRDTLANGLYNPKEGLWWRDKDFVPPYKEPNGSNCYWSRGNGWVYAALVRTMDAMLVAESADNFSFFEPIDAEKWKKLPIESHFDDYLDDFKAMSEALLKCQRTDRFWNVSLHDESNYGGKELTGTSLFIYGMAWGVRHGYLNRSRFLPVIVDTWNAMVKKCVHRSGFLGYVQGTGKEPKDSQPVGYRTEPDFDDFGLGCFLLAGTEVFKLAD